MSEKNALEKILTDPSALDAQQVVAYLQQNPDFFFEYPDLVDELNVPHPTTGKSISLIERQMWQLRMRQQKMQSDLSRFMDNAQANLLIAQKVQAFAVALMHTQSVQEAVDCILNEMKQRFDVDHVILHSFEMPVQGVAGITQLGVSTKWVQAMKSALAPVKPHCGMVEAEWRAGIFPKVDSVESVCLLPLGLQKIWGVLALGSNDARFEPHDTYFLKFMSQIITAKLEAMFER